MSLSFATLTMSARGNVRPYVYCCIQRLSFLFNLSDVTVVDATRKGNKTKVLLLNPLLLVNGLSLMVSPHLQFINHASSTASRNSLQVRNVSI